MDQKTEKLVALQEELSNKVVFFYLFIFFEKRFKITNFYERIEFHVSHAHISRRLTTPDLLSVLSICHYSDEMGSFKCNVLEDLKLPVCHDTHGQILKVKSHI